MHSYRKSTLLALFAIMTWISSQIRIDESVDGWIVTIPAPTSPLQKERRRSWKQKIKMTIWTSEYANSFPGEWWFLQPYSTILLQSTNLKIKHQNQIKSTSLTAKVNRTKMWLGFQGTVSSMVHLSDRNLIFLELLNDNKMWYLRLRFLSPTSVSIYQIPWLCKSIFVPYSVKIWQHALSNFDQ